METVRLHFVDPSGQPQTFELDFPVVHMRKPRHARQEPSDSPIFDQLFLEFEFDK